MSYRTVNLLPDRKKDSLEKLIKFLFCKEILEMILLIAAFLSMTLLWGWIILQEHFTSLSGSALLVNKEFSRYNQEVQKINFTIKTLKSSSFGFSPISTKIVDFINKLPPDIKITSLDFSRENGVFAISGVAKTRTALLNLQNSLQGFEWLEQVQSPTSQLFQKENINFEIKAKTKNIPLIEPPKSKARNADTGGE